MKMSKNILIISLIVFLSANAFASTELFMKERKQFGKPIRTKMPPQLIIESLQNHFKANSSKWQTTWQTFVVEDDESKDEFIIIARSNDKLWSYSMLKKDCPKPENHDQFMNESTAKGTPLRVDVPIGVKRKKSWFRYVVTVYEPMYEGWKNPCIMWSLPPGGLNDNYSFYNENYTLKVYSENLRNNVMGLVKELEDWKFPKIAKKIPAIRGSGQELLRESTEEFLTEEERKLPIKKQEKLLKKRLKERDKELRKLEKVKDK